MTFTTRRDFSDRSRCISTGREVPDEVRAAFVRCLASLLFTYRKYMGRPSKQQKGKGQLFAFDMDGFIRSLPHDQQDYATMMRQTQGMLPFTFLSLRLCF